MFSIKHIASLLLGLVACTPTSDPDGTTDPVENVNGNRWEVERRLAHAGCTQKAYTEDEGELLSIIVYDDFGWPLQHTETWQGETWEETTTTYERVDGKVVSSESVYVYYPEVDDYYDDYKNGTTYGRTYPDCEFEYPAKTTTITYDEAERPIQADVLITRGCTPSSTREITWAYSIEDNVLTGSFVVEEYHGTTHTESHERTYDRCGMVDSLDGLPLQNDYASDDGCDLQRV